MARFRVLVAAVVTPILTVLAGWVPHAPAAQGYGATALGGALARDRTVPRRPHQSHHRRAR